ncbi:MAG: hypothetical protein CMO40_04105 [Verrucomicrobiaceae bacterium]|nr:hypothetical protein [Verrucomicrobiaceae bacterium]
MIISICLYPLHPHAASSLSLLLHLGACQGHRRPAIDQQKMETGVVGFQLARPPLEGFPANSQPASFPQVGGDRSRVTCNLPGPRTLLVRAGENRGQLPPDGGKR